MKKLFMITLAFLFFVRIDAFADQLLYPIENNRKFGYIDKSGNIVLEPQWESVSLFHDGYAIVGMDAPYKSGLIDSTGNLCIEMVYNIEYQNGIYVLRKDNGARDQFGFFDPQSKTLVYPQYDFISHSHASPNASLVCVMENYKIGFLDRFSGELAIPFSYDEPANQAQFCDTLSIVASTEKTEDGLEVSFELLSDQNEVIAFPESFQPYASFFHGISEGKVAIVDPESGLLGFGKTDGTILCNPQFNNVYNFSEGYAAVCLNDLWGHINATGDIIVEPCYELYWGDEAPYGYAFSNGIAILSLKDKYIAIDYQGNILFEMYCDNVSGNHTQIYPFQSNGLAFCEIDGFYGLINRHGEFVHPPIWKLTDPVSDSTFSSGLEAVCMNGKYGYIDSTGTLIIDYQYEYAHNFFGELALVITNGKKAYINRDNEIVWLEESISHGSS